MESQQALDVKDTKRFLSQDPEFYLTVCNAPTEECQDRVVVQCSTAPFGKCIDAYLTPVDAAISAWWSSSQDIEYQVLPSSRFAPSEFVADFGRLVMHIQLGYAAKNGQIISHAEGRPAGMGMIEVQHFCPGETPRIQYSMDEETSLVVSKLFSASGLPSYRETFDLLRVWSTFQLEQSVRAAVRSMGRLLPPKTESNQVAFFNPIDEKWMFLPASVLLPTETT